jgi:hypothetical protein
MKNKNLLIQLDGGIGNQLFQIAAGNYFAETLNKMAKFKPPLISYEDKKNNVLLGLMSETNKMYSSNLLFLKFFRMIWKIDRKLIKLSKFYSSIRKIQDFQNLPESEVKKIHNSTKEIRGYFQSSTYASYSKNFIISLINNFQLSPLAIELMGKVLIEKPVGVHIRRGDYIKLESLYGLLSKEYYEGIFDDIMRKEPSQKFWIFSNEIQTIKNLFSESDYIKNLYFVDVEKKLTDLENLILYSKCLGHIIGNSTFSWWGAFIADKSEFVYAPEPWNKEIEYSTNIIPSGWINRESVWVS